MRAFWTTADLLARGKSRRDIRRAVEQEKLFVVRRGLFAIPSTPVPLVRAARVGGVATSITGRRIGPLDTARSAVGPTSRPR